MFFNMYPYTNFHELNLDEILRLMRELHHEWDEFTAVNKITNAGAWDITKQYQAWTVVSDNNIGYISLQPVPAGVAITNTEYWGVIADYNILITDLSNRISILEGQMSVLNNTTIPNINSKIDDLSVFVTPEMFGAVGDGVNDDTAALNQCLASPIQLKIFASNAIYSTGELDELQGRTFHIIGNNATIKSNDPNNNAIMYISSWNTESHDIIIEDLNFDGDAPNHVSVGSVPLLRLYTGNNSTLKNIVVRNCTFKNTKGHGIGVYNDNATANDLEAIISENIFEDISQVAIVQSCVSTIIKDNIFDTTGAEAITVDNKCANVKIKGNKIYHYGNGGGIGIDDANNVIITENIIDGTASTAPANYKNAITFNTGTGYSNNVIISNNLLQNNANAGIAIGSDNSNYETTVVKCSIDDNVFYSNTADIKITHADSSTSVVGSGNKFGAGVSSTITLALYVARFRLDWKVDISGLITTENGSIIDNVCAYVFGNACNISFRIKAPVVSTAGFKDIAQIDVDLPNKNYHNLTIYNDSVYYARLLNFANRHITSYLTANDNAWSENFEYHTSLSNV